MTNLGFNIYFLTKSSENVVRTIENENYPTIRLENDEEIVDHIKKLDIKAVVIDKLDFEISILKILKELVKIVTVDNVNSEHDKYVDIIVNLVKSKFININHLDEHIKTQYYCGPKYLFLRDEFDIFRENKDLKPKIEDILLIFGGSDPSNLTTRVLEKLTNNLRVDIVLGPEFKHFDDVNRILAIYDNKNFKIHYEPDNIAELMYNADLTITSPGLSMFESVYMGTPVIVIPQSNLQYHYYNSLNYEYLIKKSDIGQLEDYLDEVSSLTIRNDIIGFFKEMEIGQGTDDIIQYLSQIIDEN
jgi:spore coat polysaccharide biosynthesis predicted glycosyltransferase SpsG